MKMQTNKNGFLRNFCVAALVSLLAQCVWAATPVAVWDGDFTELTKGNVTINLNGNTKGDGYLEIASDATNGILFNHSSSTGLQNFTVIIRCSGLDLASSKGQVIATTCCGTGDNDQNKTGAYIPANNALVRGIWQGNDWCSGATQGKVPENYTSLIYNHQRTNGSYAYALEGSNLTTLFSVQGLRSSGSNYNGFAIGGLRKLTKDAFGPAHGLKITKIALFNATISTAEMAAYAFPSEVKDFTYNVTTGEWTPSTPVSLDNTFNLTLTGTGTFDLPAGGAHAALTIGEGVTLNVSESGLIKSRVTNNGTIRIVGGNDDDPIVITEDGAANTSIGTIKVAEDSVLKIHATGGNKIYTVTGENQDTSKVILTSGQNWGMTGGTAIRNCSLSIQGGCDFWFERASALDATVNFDVANGRTIHLGNPDSTFTIGALTGAGSFQKDNDSDNLKLNIGEGKTCASSVNLAGIPVTIVSGTLVAGKENAFGSSTITIEEGATLDLNGYASNGNGYTIVSNGGEIKSARAHLYANANSIGNLTLNADTRVYGGWRFGLTKASGDTSLALNGHTLKVELGTLNDTFNFRNTTVTGEGTIAIGANTYALVYDNGTGSMIAENAAFSMTSSSKLELNTQGTLTVKDFDAAAGATIIGGNDYQGTLKVLGTCTGTFSVPKLELATGAKVVGTPTVTQALTLGGTIKMADGASIVIAGTAAVPATLPLVLDDNGVVVGTLVANEGVLTVSPVVQLSALTAFGGTAATLADGVSLNLDAVFGGENKFAITSAGTVQVFKPSNNWVVDGSEAVLNEFNISISAEHISYWFENSINQKAESYFGKEAAYWTNVFGGPVTTSDIGNTPVLAQWRELGGDKTLPQYYEDQQSSNYEPILLDGKLMPYITVAEDGYKHLASNYYEGWNLRMALVNGVVLNMQALAKFQGNMDMFVGIDETSKLVVDAYNNGNNNEHKIVFDIASAEGLTVKSSMLATGNQNFGMFEYNFRGNGSIKVGGEFDLGASHAIKHVDITLANIPTGVAIYKDIISKKLIGFASHGANMTVNWASDATVSEGCTISTTPVTPLDAIGTASIALKDDGVYVEYVDYVAQHPPTYRWELLNESSDWGADGAWKGLLDASPTPAPRTWDETHAKTPEKTQDIIDGIFYINMAKPFYFYFDAAKSNSVVVDKTVHATQTGYNPETEDYGTGSRYVIVRGTGNFSFNLPQIEGVDEQGAPLSSFDFSKYDVEMQAPVDATQMNGELGLRAKITGKISLGANTKVVFVSPENEETIAYDYDIEGHEGSVEVRGAGTFIVPNTMTALPFEKTQGGFLKYVIPEGQTVTAAAISGNGGIIKAGAGTLKITEASSFTGNLKIEGGAVEVIAPPQGSEHAAITVLVSDGAEMRLVLTDLTQDYTAQNVTGKVVFVTEDGRVLRSEGHTYKGTDTPGICSVNGTEYHWIDEAITAAGSNGTVMMLAACTQNANIPAGVTIDTNGKSFTGAVTGTGTIIFKDTAPTADALTANAFTAADWTGTVWFKNIGAEAINANQPLVVAGNMAKLGNTNSTLKLTDCRGYIVDDTNTLPYTLELENGEKLNGTNHYGWTNISGYTGRSHTFKALKGSGNFIATGNCHEIEAFGTIEDFSGEFILDWGKRIVVGTTTTVPNNGGIAFADGAKFDHTITVDAKGGISFGNTIVLGEEIASDGSTVIAGLPQPATIPAIAAEDKLLVYEGAALKVAAVAAKIGDVKYASLDAAVSALDGRPITEITLVDRSITTLPTGFEDYEITDGVIVKKVIYTITVESVNVAETTIPASVRYDAANIEFTVTPIVNYVVKSVDLNGVEIEPVNGVYTCTIEANSTISITAELDTVIIDIPEVENMTVSIVDGEGNPIALEADTITVSIGSTFTVTYTPAEGYCGDPISTTYENASAETQVVAPKEPPVQAVAKIGTTLYPTLAAAFAVGGEVTLLQNTIETLTVVAGKTVTLDINGKVVKSQANTITVKGTLVVNNTAEKGAIMSVTSGKSAITTSGSGTFTINGGTIDAVGTAVSGAGTITGGTITSSGSFAVYANSSSGSIVITGGTITGAAAKGDVGVYTGNVKVTGATLANGIKFASNASGIILAGTDTELFTPELGIYDGETLVGYAPAQTTGTISAMAGKTVKLLKDCTTTDYLTIGKSCTLDLNSHNLTTSAAAAIVVKGSSATPSVVTITGSGKVSSTAADCNAVQIGAYATLTIAGGEYVVPTDNSAIYIATSYAAKPSTVAITGGSFASGDGKYVLNIKDDQVARGAAISVTGGTFKGFDPSNCISEGAGTNFVADGYESVKSDVGNNYIVQVKLMPEEPTVDEKGDLVIPTPTGAASVEVSVEGEKISDGKIPLTDTGLYTVTAKDSNGNVVSTSQIGVVVTTTKTGTEENKPTVAVAVPFKGATVANLLNTTNFADGDLLKAFINGAYAMWTFKEGKWTSGTTVLAEGLRTAPNADTTPLARGSAVWVTTEADVVAFGAYDSTAVEPEVTTGYNLIGNPMMTAITPEAKTVGDVLIPVGSTELVRYTVIDKGNGAKAWQCTKSVPVSIPGLSVDGSEEKTTEEDPTVPVGGSVWLIK